MIATSTRTRVPWESRLPISPHPPEPVDYHSAQQIRVAFVSEAPARTRPTKGRHGQRRACLAWPLIEAIEPAR